jgi:hypothetical protein
MPLILSLLLTIVSNLPDKWTVFKDANARFAVKIPCETMRHNVQPIKTAMGEMAYHSFVCEPKAADAENKVFIVSYLDYPEGMIHADSVELKKILLEETIGSSVSNIRGELAYSDDISLKGISGKFWRINYNNNRAVMKNKAFIVNNRLYWIQVATTSARSRNLEADKFLESFSWF